MRFLHISDTGDISLTRRFYGGTVPPYAVLSHTWGSELDEVSFDDMNSGAAEGKPGYRKIRMCATQARRDALQHFWIDTCCINSRDSTEVQEAINSMYRWYQNAAKCYVLLTDIPYEGPVVTSASGQSEGGLQPNIRGSRWFERGWTLQELLAPSVVEFFSHSGVRLGDKRTLESQICRSTGIPVDALRGSALSNFTPEERICWQEHRETTREEDKAYSLLGIFGVHMPLIYGEGRTNAFQRLQKEIDENSPALTRHKITFGKGLNPAALSCTFEMDQLDIRPADEPFLRFENGVSFTFKLDGQFLVQLRDGRCVWTNRNRKDNKGRRLIFQMDGNLVSYNEPYQASWATRTHGTKNAILVLSSAKPYIEILNDVGARVYRS